MTFRLSLLIFLLIQVFAGHTLASEKEVTWKDLKKLDYASGTIPPKLEKTLHQPIKIGGFIVPVELGEETEYVKEFILVPNPLACLHVPPPPPNQMILVRMNKEIPLDMDERGIMVTGKITIPRPKAEYLEFSYEMVGEKAVAADIEFEDPLSELLGE